LGFQNLRNLRNLRFLSLVVASWRLGVGHFNVYHRQTFVRDNMQQVHDPSNNPYEQERRQKLQKLRELGVDPFGHREEGITPLASIKSSHKPEMGHDGGPVVKAAGRIMLKRDMGKLSFLTLRDDSGDLQVALDKKRLDERGWQVRDLLDLGDQIVVEGNLGTTNKGEITIWATRVAMASRRCCRRRQSGKA
jgi:lysyl-tRNA synthetase class 2